MKKRLALLILVLAMLLTACNSTMPVTSSSSKAEPDIASGVIAPEINLSDLDELRDIYLWPAAFLYGATQHSWEDAEEFLPETFITMYGYSVVWCADIPQSSIEFEDGTPCYYEDAALLENYVQRYFDVHVKHLQSAAEYNAERKAYCFDMSGVGFSYDPQVLRAEYDKDIGELVLYIDSGYEEDRVNEAAALRIQLKENGEFKYTGNTCYEIANNDIDLTDLDALGGKYLYPGQLSYLATTQSWSNAEEIAPSPLVEMYHFTGLWDNGEIPESSMEQGSDGNPYYYEDEAAVESYIRQYFDVSEEHLRNAVQYDAERKAYAFNMGPTGFLYSPRVVRAEYDEGTSELRLYLNDGSPEADPDMTEVSVLTVKLYGDGSFKYVGNACYDNQSAVLDLTDLDELRSKYLWPIAFSYATMKSWEDASEIDANSFAIMYGYDIVWRANIPESEMEWGEDGHPYYYEEAVLLDSYAQQYFNVSSEHLQKADEYYNSERNAYRFDMSGVGFAYDPQVIYAEYAAETGSLVLYIDAGWGENNEVAAELTIQLEESGSFKYIGNICYEEPVG